MTSPRASKSLCGRITRYTRQNGFMIERPLRSSPFADNTMKYRRFISAIPRYYQLIGFVTVARRCLAIGVACLALFAGPRGALAAATGGAAGEPWQSLPPTPSLPAPAKSGYAPVNGIRMFYAVFGQGSPVLLLHGGLGNSNYWGEVIPILVRSHYEVIVTDSRGHGRSTRTAEPYSYELTAAQLKRITVRTAIVDGAHDEAIKPEHTKYLARTIPGAKLIILPDVSHFGMLQNPQEFSAAVTNVLK